MTTSSIEELSQMNIQQPTQLSQDNIEYEEEVEYVVMQYPEHRSGTNQQTDDSFSATGMGDGEEPFVKVGDMVFRGEWKSTFGSMLIFEKTMDNDGVETVSLVGSSRKGILLTAVELRAKNQTPLDATGDCIR